MGHEHRSWGSGSGRNEAFVVALCSLTPSGGGGWRIWFRHWLGGYRCVKVAVDEPHASLDSRLLLLLGSLCVITASRIHSKI